MEYLIYILTVGLLATTAITFKNFKHIGEGSSKIEKTITGIKKPASSAGFLLFSHVHRIVPIEAIPGIWIVIVVVIV